MELRNDLIEIISKIPLRSYQQLAIENIIADFEKLHPKLLVKMEPGTGKTAVMVSLIYILLHTRKASKILFLSSRRVLTEQTKNRFLQFFPESKNLLAEALFDTGVYFTTTAFYTKQFHFESYDVVIVEDPYMIDEESKIAELISSSKCVIGFSNRTQINDHKCWFDDARISFQYTMSQSLSEGYLSFERDPGTLNNIIKDIFRGIGYTFVDVNPSIFLSGGKEIRPDFMALHDNTHILIEVKSFQGRYVSSEVIGNAFSQVQTFKTTLDGETNSGLYQYCLIMMCEVGESRKQEFYEKTGIFVWDIANVLYYCKESKPLLDVVAAYLPYSITDIFPVPPTQQFSVFEEKQEKAGPSLESIAKMYMEGLINCTPGKEDSQDIVYQELCSEIVHFLFAGEFIKESKQHRTEDDLFRMDMLCALKGTAEFWKFLIQFYNTKFIVFEFKNYADPITQNLIYITEKYLFKPALRNVAIIISRKGFDDHAGDVALGCLKENGKLIIDITDDDLVSMLLAKIDGKEPSDILLDRTLNMLMAIGK